MDLFTAQKLTAEVKELISPYCLRIEAAGSVRRQVSDVNDIDIVLIQHPWKLEKFFISEAYRHQIETKKQRPSLKWGQHYKQIMYKGHKVELWICSKWNWGLIYLIRTGSAEFSQWILSQWKAVSKGGYSKEGYLHTAAGEKINTFEESDVFNYCKLNYIEPQNR